MPRCGCFSIRELNRLAMSLAASSALPPQPCASLQAMAKPKLESSSELVMMLALSQYHKTQEILGCPACFITYIAGTGVPLLKIILVPLVYRYPLFKDIYSEKQLFLTLWHCSRHCEPLPSLVFAPMWHSPRKRCRLAFPSLDCTARTRSLGVEMLLSIL